ncbi:MAG: cobyric acid synthase [Clostridiaceae bacterium]|nr:cobyric acid synthase [Clostridiaceae bacterium]
MPKIMIQGTGSSVGKSILVAALCRIFKQDGYSVCPYKSQNMSLNSYITMDGKEMGRAQVLQAYAAGLEPEVFMNPILLKPSSDRMCQVIVNGKVYCNASAKEYQNMKLLFANMLKDEFEKIEKQFEIIVLEGAGSPAEINLRDRDIVNMGMAKLIDAPVLLVGDIDKGGVFASLAGTMLLLTEEEKIRVKGTIINKFRGDLDILMPGVDMLIDIIKRPNLGVVPYFHLQLEDEDGAMEYNNKINNEIDIAVIKLPHMSNFTDFDALKIEEDVSVRYVTTAYELGEPDLLIIPGSKNVIDDLIKLRKGGLEVAIKDYKGQVLGICGGYQMLGNFIKDPYGVEGSTTHVKAMELLDIETVLEKEKVTTRVEATGFNLDKTLYGYEIHMGITTLREKATNIFNIVKENGKDVNYFEGAIDSDSRIMGSYLHGIFDGVAFREYLLNKIRNTKGLQLRKSKEYENLREQELDHLAQIVRDSLDIKEIYRIMGIEKNV